MQESNNNTTSAIGSPSMRNHNDGTQKMLDGRIVSPPPMRNHDGTQMLDEHGRVVYRSQFLSTHPLRSDCKERLAAPNGPVLTYITGDGVIRTMNQAFGHDGWSTEITRERQVGCEFQKGKWIVSYMATVKVTLLEGASHEDCGCGEGTSESKLKALNTAMKSAVTDAMKRAARHFGERLGNALYVYGNGMNKAPKDNKTALRDLETQEALDLFGNQKALYELRARNEQAEAQAVQNQESNVQAPSNERENVQEKAPARPTTTLTRQTTPPGVATVPTIATNKENSPSQLGHGFKRASDLNAIVTPAQAATASPSQLHGATAGSPSSMGSKPSPTARYALLNTQPSTQRSPPPSNINQHQQQTANPTKRQKVVHNPYQQH